MRLKIYNKNSILFQCASVLLTVCILSLFPYFASEKFFWLLADNAVLLRDGKIALSSFVTTIEEGLTDNMGIRDELMAINSLVLRYTGTEVVVKTDTTVVIADNGLLAQNREYVQDEEIELYADIMQQIYAASQETGASFLYVEAPSKGYEEHYPAGVSNYEKSNYDRYAQSLESRNIPFLNIREEMAADGLTDTDLFYVTDHHWNSEAGFWAFGKICERLSTSYQFEYDDFYTDINNYIVTVEPNCYLGSLAEKVGRFFVSYGLDNLVTIIPKSGDNSCEEYRVSGYLSILNCNRKADGNKILLIRDSFAGAVIPYLSLISSEIHMVDIRRDTRNEFDVIAYMKEIKPDYVLVIYNSIFPADERFDFRICS